MIEKLFSNHYKTLRLRLRKEGYAVNLLNFDNIPDTLFSSGKPRHTNTNKANSQRCSFFMCTHASKFHLASSRLIRWKKHERERIFSTQHPCFDATGYHFDDQFPRPYTTDVLDYTQYFIRQPESAKALRPLDNIQEDISFYGKEFSDALNDLYTDKVNNFKLTHIIHFEKDGLIGALFAYNDGVTKTPETVSDSNVSRVNALIHFDINESLTATRIIQYYAPNQVLFVKPNQKRFWLASIAYRDADSVFADILNTR